MFKVDIIQTQGSDLFIQDSKTGTNLCVLNIESLDEDEDDH